MGLCLAISSGLVGISTELAQLFVYSVVYMDRTSPITLCSTTLAVQRSPFRVRTWPHMGIISINIWRLMRIALSGDGPNSTVYA